MELDFGDEALFKMTNLRTIEGTKLKDWLRPFCWLGIGRKVKKLLVSYGLLSMTNWNAYLELHCTIPNTDAEFQRFKKDKPTSWKTTLNKRFTRVTVAGIPCEAMRFPKLTDRSPVEPTNLRWQPRI
jgi:hypothetical protein